MPDIVTPENRSRMMAGIKAKNTKPEMQIRSMLHRMGFRYRLHVSTLPGKPDIVFGTMHATIFVNGCFWHGHDCPMFKLPTTNTDFWTEKILANKKRDLKHISDLNYLGWRVLTIWECALRGKQKNPPDLIANEIAEWLRNGKSNLYIRSYE